MKRVVITGGTGFVGANLAARLVQDGHDVSLLVREQHQSWRIEHFRRDLHLIAVNLLDREQLRKTIQTIRPDWIFHLAAYGAYSWQPSLDRAIETNFLSTVNLIETCRDIGFETFINTGSSSEYGFKSHAPTEEDFLEPNSYYAVTKASASLFCRYTAQQFNLPVFTLRLYSVYGPYEEPGRLIPNLILKGLEKSLPPLVHPDIARDFIFTDDVNNACLFVASHSKQLPIGSIYNVGSGRQITLREIVALTREIFGIDCEPEWGSMENRSWDTKAWVANSSRLKEAGWVQNYGFEDGFLKTIDWFRTNPHLVETVYRRA